MYLSDRDLKWALDCGRLIIDPYPSKIDPTSIDLHLDSVANARIWNIKEYRKESGGSGHEISELRISKIDYEWFAKKYQIPPPQTPEADDLVFCRHKQIIVKPQGFLLWQTHEVVGTPEITPDLICFVDGKSTRARTGLVIHLTAPTIHSGWRGKITLEIANLGPFDIVLQEFEDVIAQLTVSTISSPPIEKMSKGVTYNQKGVGAVKTESTPKKKGGRATQATRPQKR